MNDRNRVFSETAPPNALEAEMALIGACILSGLGRTVALQDLQPEDFYADHNAHVFRVIGELDAEGPSLDTVTLAKRLEAKGLFEMVGGYTYLTTCTNLCTFTDSPYPYITEIKRASQRRRLITALLRGVDRARDETVPVDQVQAEVEGGVLNAREPMKPSIDPEQWAEDVELEAALVEAGQEGRRRIKTGLQDVDDRVRLWPKRISILAGGTSQGKSALSSVIAANSAFRLGQRTYIWSGEMDYDELLERWVASELGYSYEAVQLRMLNAKQRESIKEFARQVKSSPLIVRDQPMTVMDIRADCRYIAHTVGPIDLIVIDYLLLLKDLNVEAESSDRRDVRVGIMVWNLIRLAKELNCHVLLLHQLNREKDKRSTSRPRVSDLKESSTIEQHAHNVFLVYRPERDESMSDDDRALYENMMEFIVGKQRGGMVGSAWLHFDGDKQKVGYLNSARWPGKPTGPPRPGSAKKDSRR